MSMKLSLEPIVAATRIALLSLVVIFGVAVAASAQSFSSGSDGTDGALDLTGQKGTVNFVPSNFSGDQHNLNIFNFTTITIPANVTLRVSSTIVNGPMFWLASGNVDIEGTIDLSGQAGVPPSYILDGRRRAVDAGAGGYDGAAGGYINGNSPGQPVALPGDGPGGGAAGTLDGCGYPTAGVGGQFSGSSFLVPLVL